MNPINTPLPAQAKAVLAGVIAGLSALLPLMPDGFQWEDAITAVVAALVAYVAVFQTPNADPQDDGDRDPVDDDGGYVGQHRDTDPGAVLGRPTDPDL